MCQSEYDKGSKSPKIYGAEILAPPNIMMFDFHYCYIMGKYKGCPFYNIPDVEENMGYIFEGIQNVI